MKSNVRFFKIVWKLNALIILVIGIFGFFIVSYNTYKLTKNIFGTKNISSLVSVNETKEINVTYSLSQDNRVLNSSFLLTPLVSSQNYDESYYSKSSSSTRNYLFTDLKDMESKSLFDTNKYLILDLDQISKDNNSKNVKALMFKVVKADTNNDKTLTHRDKFSIFISSIDGSESNEILQNIQKISRWHFKNKDEIIMVYKQNDMYYLANIDLLNLKIKNSKKIAKFESLLTKI